MGRWLIAVILPLAMWVGACAKPASPEPVRVLYLSQAVGFVHATVAPATPGGRSPSEIALLEMEQDGGDFVVELSRDAREITPERLASIDVLMFGTTGALPIDRETWGAIVAWIESGQGGFVGVHSAADTSLAFEGGQAAYTAFLGGRFESHPWNEGTPIRLRNLEPEHPLAAMWPDGTAYAEEIYQYLDFDPSKVRVLQALDTRFGPVRGADFVPVTWIKSVGQGRLFYTNLGHTPSTWDDPRFRAQLTQAIRWTGGRIEVKTRPNPAAQSVLNAN